MVLKRKDTYGKFVIIQRYDIFIIYEFSEIATYFQYLYFYMLHFTWY
jgi:hypothetical protein